MTPVKKEEQTCPNCHSTRRGDAAYCVCGHKWGEDSEFLNWFKDVIKDEKK